MLYYLVTVILKICFIRSATCVEQSSTFQISELQFSSETVAKIILLLQLLRLLPLILLNETLLLKHRTIIYVGWVVPSVARESFAKCAVLIPLPGNPPFVSPICPLSLL